MLHILTLWYFDISVIYPQGFQICYYHLNTLYSSYTTGSWSANKLIYCVRVLTDREKNNCESGQFHHSDFNILQTLNMLWSSFWYCSKHGNEKDRLLVRFWTVTVVSSHMNLQWNHSIYSQSNVISSTSPTSAHLYVDFGASSRYLGHV